MHSCCSSSYSIKWGMLHGAINPGWLLCNSCHASQPMLVVWCSSFGVCTGRDDSMQNQTAQPPPSGCTDKAAPGIVQAIQVVPPEFIDVTACHAAAAAAVVLQASSMTRLLMSPLMELLLRWANSSSSTMVELRGLLRFTAVQHCQEYLPRAAAWQDQAQPLQWQQHQHQVLWLALLLGLSSWHRSVAGRGQSCWSVLLFAALTATLFWLRNLLNQLTILILHHSRSTAGSNAPAAGGVLLNPMGPVLHMFGTLL